MFICVFGRRGSGKTHLISGLIPRTKSPSFVVDILGNFAKDGEVVPDSVIAVEQYIEWVRDEAKMRPIVVEAKNLELDVNYLSMALWTNHGGTLVLDEVDIVDFKETKELDYIIRLGRNRGIDIITGCRRPAEVSKQITSSADIIFAFTTHEKRDVEYFRAIFGDEAFLLPELPEYHGLYIDYKQKLKGKFKTNEKKEIILLEKVPFNQKISQSSELKNKGEILENTADNKKVRPKQSKKGKLK